MRIQYVGHASILIETAGIRILTDPWLTPALDRFWEHYPALDAVALPQDIDLVLLSHHHYDHFHLPSLDKLHRQAIVLFPATSGTRATTTPGGGAFTIPWLLRRMGFTRIKALKPLETVNLGGLAITCFPSDVNFPELTFLIDDGKSTLLLAGDSQLHAATKAWFETSRLQPDLAIVPIHSTATDACFRNRDEFDDKDGKQREASESFRNYLRLLPQSAIIPGAFGWRVRQEPPPGEVSCGWMNQRIFPLTVLDGVALAEQGGSEVHCWGPADIIELNVSKKLEGEGPFWDRRDLQLDIVSEFAQPPQNTPLPTFNPLAFGPKPGSGERARIVNFVETELMSGLCDSPFYMQAIERELRTQLRVDDDLSWIIDFAAVDNNVARSDSMHFDDFVWISGNMLNRLLDCDILYGHSWGSWVGTSPLLDTVFSAPGYYMRYANRLLGSPSGVARYGL
jgi:L-ascorbate metabolism protein UlaG (beta-lactamase superfamily)